MSRGFVVKLGLKPSTGAAIAGATVAAGIAAASCAAAAGCDGVLACTGDMFDCESFGVDIEFFPKESMQP